MEKTRKEKPFPTQTLDMDPEPLNMPMEKPRNSIKSV
jgi:hypothetical protein